MNSENSNFNMAVFCVSLMVIGLMGGVIFYKFNKDILPKYLYLRIKDNLTFSNST